LKIKITVKTNSKTPGVASGKGGVYMVAVKSRAKQSGANAEAIKLLADYFGAIQTSVRIISGLKLRNKLVRLK
jgi:uncharacterized protein YggU (UPF0235/DUF167 family)